MHSVIGMHSALAARRYLVRISMRERQKNGWGIERLVMATGLTQGALDLMSRQKGRAFLPLHKGPHSFLHFFKGTHFDLPHPLAGNIKFS